MFSLLERTIAGLDRRLILLAPQCAEIPASLRGATIADPVAHARYIRDIQRLRGEVYLADGAITSDQLAEDGCHKSVEDAHSWHLVTLGADGRPKACLWYRNHQGPIGLEQLRVKRCPLASDHRWRDGLRRAVEAEISRARQDRLHYAEIGGWAVSEACRRAPDGVLLALAVFALGRILGGALGITTATVRHGSATILRRLGGASLDFNGQTVPAYYDPHYQCEMELLRFDSRRPGPRYATAVELLMARMPGVTVLAASSPIGLSTTQSLPFSRAVRGIAAA